MTRAKKGTEGRGGRRRINRSQTRKKHAGRYRDSFFGGLRNKIKSAWQGIRRKGANNDRLGGVRIPRGEGEEGVMPIPDSWQQARKEENKKNGDPLNIIASKLQKFQGDPGCVNYMRDLFRGPEFREILKPNGCKMDEDAPYQRLLAWMHKPPTGLKDAAQPFATRTLVAWQTGTGKTRGMIRVLEALWDDPRPRIIVLPTGLLVDNFYEELSNTDGRYRKWIRSAPDRASDLKTFLRRPGGMGPAGGLHVTKYSTAGGRELVNGASSLLGERCEKTKGCRLDGCIIMCDEAHNMVHPAKSMTQIQKTNIVQFGEMVRQAVGSVVLLFTATPIVYPGNHDGRSLLDICCGEGNPSRREGHVSWFMSRPEHLFAAPHEKSSKFMERPTVRWVPLKDEALRNYLERVWKLKNGRFGGKRRPEVAHTDLTVDRCLSDGMLGSFHSENGPLEAKLTKKKEEKKQKELESWDDGQWVDGQGTQPSQADGGWTADADGGWWSWDDGPVTKQKLKKKKGTGSGETQTSNRQLDVPSICAGWQYELRWNPTQYTVREADIAAKAAALSKTYRYDRAALFKWMQTTEPKLHAICSDLEEDGKNWQGKLRTAIMLHKGSGYFTLATFLRVLFPKSAIVLKRYDSGTANAEQTNAKTESENSKLIASFNNFRGNIILLPAEIASEGISLKHCDRIMIGDLSDGQDRPSWSLYQQRIARALRMCSHNPDTRDATSVPKNAPKDWGTTLRVDVYVVHISLESDQNLPSHWREGAKIPPTVDMLKYQALVNDRNRFAEEMNALLDLAADAEAYPLSDKMLNSRDNWLPSWLSW